MRSDEEKAIEQAIQVMKEKARDGVKMVMGIDLVNWDKSGIMMYNDV